MSGPRIRVVAGILIDAGRQVLIARRPDDGRHGGGYWEFPGGKLGDGESADQALARELAEEIGIRVRGAEPFLSLVHEYPERIVELDFRLVANWTGEAVALEGQELAWVAAAALDDFEMMPADRPVIERLRQRLGG